MFDNVWPCAGASTSRSGPLEFLFSRRNCGVTITNSKIGSRIKPELSIHGTAGKQVSANTEDKDWRPKETAWDRAGWGPLVVSESTRGAHARGVEDIWWPAEPYEGPDTSIKTRIVSFHSNRPAAHPPTHPDPQYCSSFPSISPAREGAGLPMAGFPINRHVLTTSYSPRYPRQKRSYTRRRPEPPEYASEATSNGRTRVSPQCLYRIATQPTR
ncbi:hypothetical protein R3P38DRAFT_3475447 [Favolaschia claudopus]|uniref:Uncharacterized protein n=1 Tax=Favolaschia claudopus TaxID=2862362 RepID=A0AAW0CI15_9AGAR